MNSSTDQPETQTVAETENYLAWKASGAGEETSYHLELGNVTVHFFQSEWDEFLELARALVEKACSDG